MPYRDPNQIILYQVRYRNSHKEQIDSYQEAYRKKYQKQRNKNTRWHMRYGYDWLYLQLGNKCSWCDRTNQQAPLEVDHILGKLRFRRTSKGYHEMLRDYFHGEPLRLLCRSCHEVRHSL